MTSLKAVLVSLFRSSPLTDYDDPLLGVMAWRPATECWISQPLPPANRFCIEIPRHNRSPAPTEDCLRVAHQIARHPDALEEHVRTLLVYEAACRPPELRSRIIGLKVERITLQSGSGEVSGEVLLLGDPPLTNWSVWPVNGVPSQVAQHWESSFLPVCRWIAPFSPAREEPEARDILGAPDASVLVPAGFQQAPAGSDRTVVVPDVGAVQALAMALGLLILQEPRNEFHGQRRFLTVDPKAA
jgi:hypothetical protein